MRRNIHIASEAAMSFFSSNSVVSPILGGTTVVGPTALCTYETIELVKEEKERVAFEEKMHFLNVIYERYLKRIHIGEVEIGFPAIFQKKAENYGVFRYSKSMMEGFVSTALSEARYTPELSHYKEHIVGAIRLLKQYRDLYFENSKLEKNRFLTVSVIEYLMHILEVKCLHFEGYDVDIAVLDAIKKFANEFACITGDVDSQHFTMMKPVFGALEKAKMELEKHRDSRSQVEEIAEQQMQCHVNVDKFIRNLLKILSSKEQWPLIHNAAMHILVSTQLISLSHTRRAAFGHWHSKIEPVDVPNSMPHRWLKRLIRYHWDVLGAGDVAIPNLSEISLSGTTLTWDEIEKLKNIFKSGNTVFTETTVVENGSCKIVPVSKNADIMNRLSIISDYMQFVYLIISLHLLLINFVKANKNLGEISHVNYFRQLYNLYYRLCETIKTKADELHQKILVIRQENQAPMKETFAQLFDDSVHDEIIAIKNIVATQIHTMCYFQRQYRKISTQCQATSEENNGPHSIEKLSYALEPLLGAVPFVPTIPLSFATERNEFAREENHVSSEASRSENASVAVLRSNEDTESVAVVSTTQNAPKEAVSSIVRKIPECYSGIFQHGLYRACDMNIKSPWANFLYAVREMLLDYTKQNSTARRFFSGHPNRHHISAAVKITQEISDKIRQARDCDDQDIKNFIEKVFNDLDSIKHKETFNIYGSLAKRIQFIQMKYAELLQKETVVAASM